MNSKRIKYIGLIVFIIVVAYLFYVIVEYFITISQLKAMEGNQDFPTTELFDVSENRITNQVVIYNNQEIIEYFCCIDSFYLIDVVKIGTMKSSSDFLNSIHFLNKFPFEKQSSKLVSIPPPLDIHFWDFSSLYDIKKFPIIDVENINIYIEEELLKQDTLTNCILASSIKASFVSFEFNNSNAENMRSISKKGVNPNVSKLILYKSEDNILYVILISTIDGSNPEITSILKL